MPATPGRHRGTAGYHRAAGAPLQRMPVDRIPVWLHAADSISRAGLAATLRPRPDIRLVDAADAGPDSVVVLAVDRVDDDARRRLAALRRRGFSRIVLIASTLGNERAGVVAGVVGDGVSAVVRRSDTTPALLVRLVAAAASRDAATPARNGNDNGTAPGNVTGNGAPPSSVSGNRASAASAAPSAPTRSPATVAPSASRAPGRAMSEREVAVLLLVAEGFDTREIAERLRYSERTVKTILNDVTNRFNLRNRSHAVAYALREGLIT